MKSTKNIKEVLNNIVPQEYKIGTRLKLYIISIKVESIEKANENLKPFTIIVFTLLSKSLNLLITIFIICITPIYNDNMLNG